MSNFVVWVVALAGLLTAPLASPRAQAPSGIPVQVAKAEVRDVPIILRNIGSVQAFNADLVRARVDGTIEKVFFTEGQDVKAGDPLVQIDPRPYAAAYAAALAKRASDAAILANAQRDLSRYSSLVRQDFASRQQVDTQQSTVQQTQAAIQGDDAQIMSAKLNLDYATVRSPIDGRVGLRLVDVGNLVHANDATGIVNVTQIHPISVVFTLPQEDLPQIQDGMARGTLPVTAYAANDQLELGTGQLLTIDDEIDTNTGTIKLKATFPNPDSRLWPGEFINAHVQVGEVRHALVVPLDAVEHGPDGLYVFAVQPDQTVKMTTVETGLDDGHDVVITKGLAADAEVVINGQSRLQDGSHIAINSAQANG
jgi:multidrug efflux system membrane fusion protein